MLLGFAPKAGYAILRGPLPLPIELHGVNDGLCSARSRFRGVEGGGGSFPSACGEDGGGLSPTDDAGSGGRERRTYPVGEDESSEDQVYVKTGKDEGSFSRGSL